MPRSEQEYKRARPLLGTILSIHLSKGDFTDPITIDEIVRRAFELAEQLQSIFSAHDINSRLTSFNRAELGSELIVESELYYLLQLALKLWKSSSGSFIPFKNPEAILTPIDFYERENLFILRKVADCQLDLGGIAKGYIVDRVVEFLKTELPSHAGVVNAGGDLKFFNTPKRCTTLRLGAYDKPVIRSITINADCIASSSVSVSRINKNSSTTYTLPLRKYITENHTAVVMSHCCCLADSLTKVALFGAPETIETCARKFQSKIFIFSPAGSLQESYGET